MCEGARMRAKMKGREMFKQEEEERAESTDSDNVNDANYGYAQYPVSFHGHRSSGVKAVERRVNGVLVKKKQKLSMECVDEMVRGRRSWGMRVFKNGNLEKVVDGDDEEKRHCVGEQESILDVDSFTYRPKIWDWRGENAT